MLETIKNFVKEENGGIAENAALIVLTLIIVVGVMMAISPKIKSAQEASGTKLDEAKDFTY